VRPRPDAAVISWLAGVDEDETFLSVVTIGELSHGIELLPRGARQDRLAHWLAADLIDRFEDRVLEVRLEVSKAWGRLMAVSSRAGRPMSVIDGYLAATAVVHELTLVTRNVRDFNVAGIDLLDPRHPG